MRIVAIKGRWSTWVVRVERQDGGPPFLVWIDGASLRPGPGGEVTGRRLSDDDGRITRERWYFLGPSPEWPFPPWVKPCVAAR